MKSFSADLFFRIGHALAEFGAMLNRPNSYNEQTNKLLIAMADDVIEACSEGGFEFSIRFLERMKHSLSNEQITGEHVKWLLSELYMRIDDEMKSASVMLIPKDKNIYFNKTDLFGSDVTQKLPSANIDIEEAGKCFASGRNTACVFHLMRVMEIGVKAFATELGIYGQLKTAQPSWGEVLRLTNQEIQAKNKIGDSTWTSDKRGFFENIQADLVTVKNAWRNTTMHVENIYDEERAEDIFNAVKGFMRHLSKHLNELGQYTP